MSQCLTCDQLKDRAYLRLIHKKLNNVLSARSCKDCGESNPLVLEFSSGEVVWKLIAEQMPWVKINEVIAKSETVCANCNRLRVAEAVGPFGIPNPDSK